MVARMRKLSYNYVAYFKIICAMGVERRDKGSALFHIKIIHLGRREKAMIIKAINKELVDYLS